MANQTRYKKLILSLYSIGAVKFGTFTLKSGEVSPIYIDLRILVSHPKVMLEVAKAYLPILKNLKYKRMAGVPYAALPIVATISMLNRKPWIYNRKEVKDYGTKKQIEGEYKEGETVVVIDDLVTTGLSKLEVIKIFKEAKLKVRDIAVLIYREQGGMSALKKKGYKLYYAFSVNVMADVLFKEGKISKKRYQEVIDYFKNG
ncbi:MAG: orotate phosphoribosyltransferase [bacterium]|nr:orotate phosphoribosyltransferase [bacterium]